MEANGPFNRILVAVGPGELSSNAVVAGFTLAKDLDCKLDLVHAVDVPPALWHGVSEDELATMHAQTLEQARVATIDSAQHSLDDAGIEDEHLESYLRVRPGHPAKVILTTAEEIRAELIVLGPHAKRSRFDFGSTARAVLSRATSPVWTQVGAVERIRKILVPLDFSEHGERVLDVAHALAARIGASIEVLHSYAPPAFAYSGVGGMSPAPTYVVEQQRSGAREELDCAMAAYPWGSVVATPTFVDDDPTAAILQAEERADLVVMGTHGRTGLSRFLLGSVAYRVLKESTKPVLVVPSASGTWLI